MTYCMNECKITVAIIFLCLCDKESFSGDQDDVIHIQKLLHFIKIDKIMSKLLNYGAMSIDCFRKNEGKRENQLEFNYKPCLFLITNATDYFKLHVVLSPK